MFASRTLAPAARQVSRQVPSRIARPAFAAQARHYSVTKEENKVSQHVENRMGEQEGYMAWNGF